LAVLPYRMPGLSHSETPSYRACSGKALVLEGIGYFARCLAYETDHVNGHVYLDRLSQRDRKDALRQVADRRTRCSGAGPPGWSPGSRRSAGGRARARVLSRLSVLHEGDEGDEESGDRCQFGGHGEHGPPWPTGLGASEPAGVRGIRVRPAGIERFHRADQRPDHHPDQRGQDRQCRHVHRSPEHHAVPCTHQR